MHFYSSWPEISFVGSKPKKYFFIFSKIFTFEWNFKHFCFSLPRIEKSNLFLHSYLHIDSLFFESKTGKKFHREKNLHHHQIFIVEKYPSSIFYRRKIFIIEFSSLKNLHRQVFIVEKSSSSTFYRELIVIDKKFFTKLFCEILTLINSTIFRIFSFWILEKILVKF